MKYILAFLLVVVVIGTGLVTYVVGKYNYAVQAEINLDVQYVSNKNEYDKNYKTFNETAQVAGMQADDTKKIYETLVQGRESKSANEMVRFIQESNPNLDSSVYKTLQQLVASGRASFQAKQDILIDKVGVYRTNLQTMPGALLYGALGFPKVNLSKYDPVTSNRTEEAYETKRDEPMQLRPTAEKQTE